MRRHHLAAAVLLLVAAVPSAAAVGVCWGAAASHPLAPATVVAGLLRPNNVSRVRLFDAEAEALQSLAGTGIGVTVGVPNEMLRGLSASKVAARSWVHENVSRYLTGVASGVKIEYVAVGDEPFLLCYKQQFQPFVVGAATNIQLALLAAKLENRVKVIVPCNSDAYHSVTDIPSAGQFRPDLNKTMSELLSFLTKHGSPFVVDINPFLSLQQNKNLSLDYFLLQPISHPVVDGRHKYENSFDASIDTLLTSLSKAGIENIDIIVGKIGWPTDGAVNATSTHAHTFMQGLLQHLQSKSGTPLRPKGPPIETYIFSLLDEDQRSISTGNFERHWGIFTFDGQAKYNVDLGQGSKYLANAPNLEYLPSKWCVVNNNKDLSNVSASVSFACSNADCTPLSPGGSCFNLTWPGNVSYAFNSYYQQHDQNADSCDFSGLGLITTVDPTVGDCRFAIPFDDSFSISMVGLSVLLWPAVLSACVSAYLLPFRWF